MQRSHSDPYDSFRASDPPNSNKQPPPTLLKSVPYPPGPSFAARPSFYKTDYPFPPTPSNFCPQVKLPPIRNSTHLSNSTSLPMNGSSSEGILTQNPPDSVKVDRWSREKEPRPSSAPSRPPSAPQSKMRRSRLGLSCQECRRRKIACDRLEPCSTCIRRGKEASCCKAPFNSEIPPSTARLNSAKQRTSTAYFTQLPSPPPTSNLPNSPISTVNKLLLPLEPHHFSPRRNSTPNSSQGNNLPPQSHHSYRSIPSTINLTFRKNEFYLFKKGDLDTEAEEEQIFAWSKPHTFL